LLLARLAQLRQQNPQRFRAVAAEIADDLRRREPVERHSAQLLAELAEQFGLAADVGDLSPLEPARPSWNPPTELRKASIPASDSQQEGAPALDPSRARLSGARFLDPGVAEALKAALERVNAALETPP
jgi:hypothetical protein